MHMKLLLTESRLLNVLAELRKPDKQVMDDLMVNCAVHGIEG